MTRGVLVAESDATELELIATVLARDGFHVVRASDGDSAIASFEGCELVVCASELTSKDGAAVCAAIKRAKPETRFVLLHPSGNDVDACSILLSRIGCDAVLPSPFRYDALKAVLSEWGLRAPTRTSVVPMSFAVPAPDIATLVAAPSIESLLPPEPVNEPIAPMAASADAPIAVPIPIPVVFPAVVETPPLAEYAGDAVPAPIEKVAVETEAVAAEPVAAELPEDVRAALYEYAMSDDFVAPPPPAELGVPASPQLVSEEVVVAGALLASEELTVAALQATPEELVVAAPQPTSEELAVAAQVSALEEVVVAAPQSASEELVVGSTQFAPEELAIAGPPPASEELVVAAPPPAPEELVVAAPPSASEELVVAAPPPASEELVVAVPPPAPEELVVAAPPPTPEELVVAGPPSAPEERVVASPRSAVEDFVAAPPVAEEPVVAPPPPPDEITMDLPPPPPEELAVAPVDLSAEPALQGDWLLAPPPDEDTDGFAGLDFGSGLDSVLDAALGDIPTARVEAAATADEPAAELPPPPPLEVLPDPAAIDIELAPPPALSVSFTHQPTAAPEDTAAIDIGMTPPPPPREADASVKSGATVWAPSSTTQASTPSPTQAPRIEARGIVTPPPSPPPDDRPPPPPVDARAGEAPRAQPPSPAALDAPPPPPSEALNEPPALPFEAITQRTPATSEPRTTLPPGVPPEGDLQTTPLPRLLFELYGGTYCGALRLTRKGAERTIDVWNGFPVAMTLNPPPDNDDLATLLREHGRITPDQFADARKRAPGREAQLLVALGIIDERDLLDVIREQTELRLAASFSWRDGTYKITPSKEPPDSVVLSEVHPVKIIWRGVCEHYDVGSLLAFFSTLRARYIVATEVFPIHYQTLGPFLRRVGVAHLLDGRTTFEQALRSDDSQALAIAQTLYVLIVTEMIRAQSTPGVQAVFPEAAKPAGTAKPVDYRDLARACEDVAKSYLALKGRDFFAMLELQRNANEAEVASSYERLARRFKPENLLPGLPDDVVRRAREIDGLLRRARDTLISPEERRRYTLRLADTEPPPPPLDNLAAS